MQKSGAAKRPRPEIPSPKLGEFSQPFKAWQAFINKKKSCPWVTDEGEMVKKTCIKQAYKYWPKAGGGDKLEKAIQYLNTHGGEGLELEQQSGPGTISATDGAMASQPISEQERLRDLADKTKLAFESDGIGLAFDLIERAELDVDQKVAFWSVLPSQIRTALKKESKARADAARTVESA